MKRREAVLAFVLTLGAVFVLAASPASAIGPCASTCACNLGCGKLCLIDPLPPEGFNQITCGDWGVCLDSLECICAGATCTSTLNGTSGGDTLNGGTASECINGLGGDDTIDGNGGNDYIRGGDGNDSIFGDSGNDCLVGDAGNDNVTGQAGTDACYAEFELSCEQ